MIGAPYRVPPPDAGQLIAWPERFGTRVLVFADVEEEFDWRQPLSAANRATGAMAAFPAAHRRFADHGIGIACMVDHPVATDPRSIDILRGVIADGRSEIGTQLHAWVTPPYVAAAAGDSYAGNLPLEVEAAKLDTITAALAAAFGRSPRIYRAGRYGIGAATLALLAARGYRIDSSVRARYDYRYDLGPDFTAIGTAAYRVGGLIEVPLTAVFTGALRAAGPRLYGALGAIPHGRGVLARTGLLQRVALTPEDMPIADALEAVAVALGEGERLLTISFHSPSLAPGHTPYVRDAADLAAFWRWWDRMLARLAQRGVAPVTIDEILAAADAARPQAGTP